MIARLAPPNTFPNNTQPCRRRRRVHSTALRHRRSQLQFVCIRHRALNSAPASRVALALKINDRTVLPALNTMNAALQQPLLPRVLPRPSLSEVDASNIGAACPELQNVAPQYIREKLLLMAPQMYSSLSNVRANPPRHALPKELEIVIDDTSCCPTHMLAIYSSSPQPNQTRQVTMYPTHHLVLASHCANLPVFPPSCPTFSGSSSSTRNTATIPVVSLSVPSPPTFPLLHAYLYTKNDANLVAALLSSPSGPNALRHQAALTHGVWGNAHALGVVDEHLFDVLDRAWQWVSTTLENAS